MIQSPHDTVPPQRWVFLPRRKVDAHPKDMQGNISNFKMFSTRDMCPGMWIVYLSGYEGGREERGGGGEQQQQQQHHQKKTITTPHLLVYHFWWGRTSIARFRVGGSLKDLGHEFGVCYTKTATQ